MRRADHSSRGVLPSVVCLSVIVKPRKMRLFRPPRGCRAIEKKCVVNTVNRSNWMRSHSNEDELHCYKYYTSAGGNFGVIGHTRTLISAI
jgi:hypothetical protein